MSAIAGLRRGPPPETLRRIVKPAVIALGAVPLLLILWRVLATLQGWDVAGGDLGANPVQAILFHFGDWAIRLLLVALAISPLRTLTGAAWLTTLRRSLGLWAFAYALLHMLTYVGVDQFFHWPTILADITKRNFIIVGMAALVLMIPLAVTSTDRMVRRLGWKRWRLLHRLAYPVAILAVTHNAMHLKAGLSGEPLVHVVVLALLLAARLPLSRLTGGGGDRRARGASAR